MFEQVFDLIGGIVCWFFPRKGYLLIGIRVSADKNYQFEKFFQSVPYDLPLQSNQKIVVTN